MPWRMGTLLLRSFESTEDGLNEDECATSTDLEHNTSNGLDTILSWGERKQTKLKGGV